MKFNSYDTPINTKHIEKKLLPKFNSNFDPEKIYYYFSLCLYAVVILLLFVGLITRAVTTQQALDQECKSNYNLLQVALAGDNLSRICQLKNQTPTIK